jgi:hypothetical protein
MSIFMIGAIASFVIGTIMLVTSFQQEAHQRMTCQFVIFKDGTVFVPRTESMDLCLFFKDESTIVYRQNNTLYCHVPRYNGTTYTTIHRDYNCIMTNGVGVY